MYLFFEIFWWREDHAGILYGRYEIDETKIYDLANNGFTIYAGKNNEAEGGFEHSGNFALIDKNGYIRSRLDAYGNPMIYYKGIVSLEEQEEDGEQEEISVLIEDIQKLLRE